MGSELVRQLINSGIHFGHRASRWNPKMKPYIFGKLNTIHIIDIRETVKGLLRAKRFIAKVVSSGEDVIFVGTKRQARIQIKEHATRVGMPWVTDRWLGGTLTNFRTIRSRLVRLEELEAAEADGSSQQYSKKMIATRTREQRKIQRNLAGIREMHRLPAAVIIVDVHRERNAVLEARKLNIPTICLIDTDSDPDFADIPNAPIAAFFIVILDILVALAVNDGSIFQIKFSAVNDSEKWTADCGGGAQQVPDGGPVIGGTGGDYGVILQENGLRRMAFVGGDLRFRTDRIEGAIGCVAADSIVKYKGRTF